MNKIKIVFALITMSIILISCDNNKTHDALRDIANQEKPIKDGMKIAEEVKGVIEDMPDLSKDVYTLSEVDQAPFFGQKCEDVNDLSKCNQHNIVSFIKNNIELPIESQTNSAMGLEYVKVTIREDGTMADLKYVKSKNSKCTWCQQTAVDVVGKMQSWAPALKNGKPVPVVVTIPIKFLS